MAYRFSVGCCCDGVKPCIPECKKVFEGVICVDQIKFSNGTVEEDELVISINDLIDASRHCKDELFFKGFWLRQGVDYATAITTDTRYIPLSNSIIFYARYANGTHYDSDYGVFTAITSNPYGNSLVRLTNSIAYTETYNQYFVTDIDGKTHYDPSISEPPWVEIYSMPYDYEKCPFVFRPTGASAESWSAAHVVTICTLSELEATSEAERYKTPTDCSFETLRNARTFVINGTFNEALAREAFHTGNVNSLYIISATGYDSWLDSEIGQHHYGSDFCRVDLYGFYSGSRPYIQTKHYDVRFNLDTDATPMLPVGEYSSDITYDTTVNGSTVQRQCVFVDGEDLPTLWRTNATKRLDCFYGDAWTHARAYSYSSNSMTGTFKTFDLQFPLGRFRVNITPRTRPSSPMVQYTDRLSGLLYDATLDKSVNDFLWSDFARCFPNFRAYFKESDVSSDSTGNEVKYPCCWIGLNPRLQVYKPYIVDGTNYTPQDIIQDGFVFGFLRYSNSTSSAFIIERYRPSDGNSIHVVSSAHHFITSRQVEDGDLIYDANSWYDTTDVNDARGSFTLGFRRINDDNNNAVIVPEVPNEIISSWFSNVYSNYSSDYGYQNVEWYAYPLIDLIGYVITND